MDYRNDSANFDRNTILYGHSRVNGTMFGTLKNILKSDWINNKGNYIVRLSTLTENTLWQVFSVYTIPVESYYITIKFRNEDAFEEWTRIMLHRSQHNFNTTVDKNDKVLTLSTCHTSKQRVIMHAKLIKRTPR